MLSVVDGRIQSELHLVADELISGLKAKGFADDVVSAVMDDADIRLKWGVDSECSLYSRSADQWFKGKVVEMVVDDDNTEWMVVRYGPKRKRVQKFCADLKPIEFGAEYRVNVEALQFVVDRLRAKKGLEVRCVVDCIQCLYTLTLSPSHFPTVSSIELALCAHSERTKRDEKRRDSADCVEHGVGGQTTR